MKVFARGIAGVRLFEESMEQGVVLWQGENLRVYAASRKWSLQQKLKRYGSNRRKDIDLHDAIFILKQLTEANEGPTDRMTIKGWNTTPSTPIQDWILDELAREYEAKYQAQGIIS